jgi:uncharacterized metal-binding protein
VDRYTSLRESEGSAERRKGTPRKPEAPKRSFCFARSTRCLPHGIGDTLFAARIDKTPLTVATLRQKGRIFMNDKAHKRHDCSDCQSRHCDRRDSAYPSFCPTIAVDAEQSEEIKALYREDPLISKMYAASAEIEGLYYGKLTRVEEIVLFAKRIGAKKPGIASCMGSMTETGVFTRILEAKGIRDYLCVTCKVGSVEKTDAGIPETHKIHPNRFEPACNPILQARILNDAHTDLNILIGLCVGHDALFSMHSKAPCVTLAVKDRVLQQNPMAAIYGVHSYYKRLLQEDDIV